MEICLRFRERANTLVGGRRVSVGGAFRRDEGARAFTRHT